MVALLIVIGVICLWAGLLLTSLMQGKYDKWIDDVELKDEDVE